MQGLNDLLHVLYLNYFQSLGSSFYEILTPFIHPKIYLPESLTIVRMERGIAQGYVINERKGQRSESKVGQMY